MEYLEKCTLSQKKATKLTNKTEYMLVCWIEEKTFTVLDIKCLHSKCKPKIDSIQKIKFNTKLDAQVKFIGIITFCSIILIKC